MREIKFRAWRKNQTPLAIKEKVFPIYYLEWPKSIRGINWWDIFDGKPRHIKSFISLDANVDDEFILMQYTGLKDKNGKEIYEGDIIKSRAKELLPVVFHRWMFCLKRENVDGTSYTGLDYNMPFEIVGNIYENPELLT